MNREGERVIRSTLSQPVGAKRKDYELALPSGIEVGLKGWHRAHSQGRITGAESPYGILYAPQEVNIRLQRFGTEAVLNRMAKLQLPADEALCLVTNTKRHVQTMMLAEIQYKVEARKTGQVPKDILQASITVAKQDVKPTIVTEVQLWNAPASLAEGLKQAKQTQ